MSPKYPQTDAGPGWFCRAEWHSYVCRPQGARQFGGRRSAFGVSMRQELTTASRGRRFC